MAGFWSRAQYVLFSLDKPRSVASIQRKTGFARQTVMDAVKKLEEKGLVTTSKESKYIIVYVTDFGKQVRKDLLEIYRAVSADK